MSLRLKRKYAQQIHVFVIFCYAYVSSISFSPRTLMHSLIFEHFLLRAPIPPMERLRKCITSVCENCCSRCWYFISLWQRSLLNLLLTPTVSSRIKIILSNFIRAFSITLVTYTSSARANLNIGMTHQMTVTMCYVQASIPCQTFPRATFMLWRNIWVCQTTKMRQRNSGSVETIKKAFAGSKIKRT